MGIPEFRAYTLSPHVSRWEMKRRALILKKFQVQGLFNDSCFVAIVAAVFIVNLYLFAGPPC